MLGKFLSHITTAVGNSKRHPQNQFADHGAASGGCIVEKGVLLSFEVNSERCVIPEGVTELREFAINYNRDRIKEVVLPSTIRYIREHNFSSCVNLERINFPEGLVEKVCGGVVVRYAETPFPVHHEPERPGAPGRDAFRYVDGEVVLLYGVEYLYLLPVL